MQGGGWVGGGIDQVAPVATAEGLAAAGYCCVVSEYRLSGVSRGGGQLLPNSSSEGAHAAQRCRSVAADVAQRSEIAVR